MMVKNALSFQKSVGSIDNFVHSLSYGESPIYSAVLLKGYQHIVFFLFVTHAQHRKFELAEPTL